MGERGRLTSIGERVRQVHLDHYCPGGAGLPVTGSLAFGLSWALTGISFDVRLGEVLGLIGPNGAGKTTLLEVMAGVLPADAGDVRWRGVPLPVGRRREVMFYLPDGLRPWDDHYVTRVLEFFADEAKKLGVTVIHLEVNHGNPAVELYHRLGFVDHHRYLMTKWILEKP